MKHLNPLKLNALMIFTFVSISGFSVQSFALSHFTSVDEKDCVVADSDEIDKDAEIDFLDAECPGLGGYRVLVSGGDLRYGITLGYGKKQIPLDRMGSFHELGSKKIEWVYERPKKQDRGDFEGVVEVKYLALIHRISHMTFNDKKTSKLFVTKLAREKSCVVGIIEAANDMNKTATAMAHRAQNMPCLEAE